MFASLAAAASSATSHAGTAVLAVCPAAPPGAQVQVDKLTSYVLWGVLIAFFIGLALSLGAVALGRALSMPHASKAGVVGLLVMFACAIGYVVLPPILDAITGSGCVS